MPPQCRRKQIWQSLEESAGKRCSESRDSVNRLPALFLQTLPDLVTSALKGHSLSPRSCPPTRSVPSERFEDCGSSIASRHTRKHETHPPRILKKEKEKAGSGEGWGREKEDFRLDSNDFSSICTGVNNVISYERNVWYYLSCLYKLTAVWALSSKLKLFVSWQIFDTYGVINCGSAGLEEGVVNQCLEFGVRTRSKPWLLTHFTKMMMKCCFTVYVHRNRRLIRDGSPGRPPRLTFTQLLSSAFSKLNMVLQATSTEIIRLIRDGDKGAGRGCGGGGRGRLYTYRCAVTTVSRFGLAVVSGRTSVWYCFGSPFSSKRLRFVDTVLWFCPSLPTETLKIKWLSSLPILMQKSFWLSQCSDRYITSLSPHLHTPFPPPPPPFSPSLIGRTVFVDVKHHVYCHNQNDSCIKIGSNESHFNVSVGSDEQSHKTVSTPAETTTFLKRKESRSGIEPRALCLPV